jgi:hypothetical protein
MSAGSGRLVQKTPQGDDVLFDSVEGGRRILVVAAHLLLDLL